MPRLDYHQTYGYRYETWATLDENRALAGFPPLHPPYIPPPSPPGLTYYSRERGDPDLPCVPLRPRHFRRAWEREAFLRWYALLSLVGLDITLAFAGYASGSHESPALYLVMAATLLACTGWVWILLAGRERRGVYLSPSQSPPDCDQTRARALLDDWQRRFEARP